MPGFNIVVFAGDGVGPEITDEAVKVLKAIEKARPAVTFNFQPHLLGGASIDASGIPLTDEALSAAAAADAVWLGAVGGPKWGTAAVRPEQGILKLRKSLDTFANLRPAFFPTPALASLSPLKEDVVTGTDFVVVRELTGGIYFGKREEAKTEGTEEKAYDTEEYSRSEIERVARLAGWLARQRSGEEKRVTSLDKANVLATSRMWRRVVTEVFEKEFPDVKVQHQLIDSATMLVVKNPTSLNGVVLTNNIFGDIITDECAAIIGSLGLGPSASLASLPSPEKPTVKGIYEPIHGSAPDIAGQGVVNPVASLLSVAMLLRYSLGMSKEADLVEKAIGTAIEGGARTKDIQGNCTTKEVGDRVVAELEKLL
ncbi:MAG: 3-isopropylmalate dehydrogenase [Cirrosporium novae-zelandiae]|nr:MAG: 3-isopropylmalate dehydrogenase [Cirrosporium novae-zelandiae]